MSNNQPIHSEITPWFPYHFQTEMIRRARVAHADVRSNKLAPESMSMLCGAMVQALSNIEEATTILMEMCPGTFDDLPSIFASDFKHFRDFRDDAAHLADKCFRIPNPAWQHETRVDSPQWGKAVEILHYDYAIDTLRTGDHVLHLETAIGRAEAIVLEVKRRLVQAGTTGEIKFPPMVTPEGKPIGKLGRNEMILPIVDKR